MNSADPQQAAETAAFYDANAGTAYGYCLSLCVDSEIAVNAFHRAMVRAWSSGGGRARVFAYVRAECRMRGLRTPTPAIDESDRDARALAPVFTRLPPRDAEAAELTLRFGLGVIELAGVFGLPVEHAQRLVTDARALFMDALTAESQVGVSEGVLSELTRSAYPLARVAGLMPPVEPPAEVRAKVLAGLHRFDPEKCCSHRHVPGVIHPYLGRTGPVPWTRRVATRCAVLACSLLVALGFVTGLSRPSGVESMMTPPPRAVADPPLPTASVKPSHRPAAPPVPRTTAPPARPSAGSPSIGGATTPASRPHGGARGTSPRHDWGDRMRRLYGDWRDQERSHDGGRRAPYDGPHRDWRDRRSHGGGYDGRHRGGGSRDGRSYERSRDGGSPSGDGDGDPYDRGSLGGGHNDGHAFRR